MTPPAPVTRTALHRALYENPHEKRTIAWLAAKLGVTRQQVGQWCNGHEPIPRKRQAQMRLHLELPTAPLFDERGFARKV